jgi:3-oxoacid CoA-transferase
MAATVTIAEVEELVEPGEIDPDDVHLPGIYVRRVLPLTADQVRDKRIERIVVRPRESATVSDPGHDSGSRPRRVPARIGWTRDEMAARAAEELADGDYVNLGIGLPTLVPSFVPDDLELVLHSGNGVLGVGPYPYDGDADADADTVDAGKAAVTLRRGASAFDSSASFAMIRGGRIDAAVLGAMQVSERGDIANWMIPGSIIKGMGGAMDLAAGAKRVIVLMDHLAKDGSTKVMRECSLPITGLNVADRIITNLCVFDVTPGGLILRDLAPGVTEEQVRRHTEPAFTVGDVLSSQR